MPRVSIILPTYNRSALLSVAIRSVLQQSYTDYELLIVDDGSTDDTEAVVRSFQDSRISYIWKENQGRSAARNAALRGATGEFVAFLDDDDFYLPARVERQVAYLDRIPEIGLVASGVLLVDWDGDTIREWRTWIDQPNLSLPDLLFSCPLLSCAVMVRRSEVDRLDYYFDCELERAEDVDFYVRLSSLGCVFAWQTEILSAYRIHRGSSQQDGMRYFESYQRLLAKLYSQDYVEPGALENKVGIYAHHALLGAMFCYATRQEDSAKDLLARARGMQPAWFRGKWPHFLTAVTATADSFRVEHPEAFIDDVFVHLSAECRDLRQFRGKAHAMLHAGRIFRAYQNGLAVPLNEFPKALTGDWSYFTNMGLWSIGARSALAHLGRVRQ